MTYDQVKQAYHDEMTEICLASQEQIDRLCAEIGNDLPQVRYDNASEEMDAMYFDALKEFDLM